MERPLYKAFRWFLSDSERRIPPTSKSSEERKWDVRLLTLVFYFPVIPLPSPSESVLFELGVLLKETRFKKESIGWDLLALEALGNGPEAAPEPGREPDSDDESEDEGGLIPEDSDSCSMSSTASSSSLSSSGSSDEADISK